MRKSKMTITGLAVAMALLTFSSGNVVAKTVKASGKYVTKEIKAESFSSIKLLGSEDILYSQSTNGKSSIKVYTSDNVVDLLDIRVESGTLIVSYKKNTTIWGNNPVKVIVSSPSLNNVEVLGSGDVAFKTAIQSDDLSLRVQGSGDIDGSKVTCNQLSTNVQGSGNINIKNINSKMVLATLQGSGDIELGGNTESAKYDATGSGDISAGKLKSQNVNASLTGSGDITCYAVKTLKTRVIGSGDINYKGSPTIDSTQKRKIHNLR